MIRSKFIAGPHARLFSFVEQVSFKVPFYWERKIQSWLDFESAQYLKIKMSVSEFNIDNSDFSE